MRMSVGRLIFTVIILYNIRRIFDERLNMKVPSLVYTQWIDKSGKPVKDLMHTYVIVGWDATEKAYLVFDPGGYNKNPFIAKSLRTGGKTNTGWEQDIRGII